MSSKTNLPPETQELSMEEILASIRRVVTEEPAGESSQKLKTSNPKKEVIDLTQMVDEKGNVIDMSRSAPASKENIAPKTSPSLTPPAFFSKKTENFSKGKEETPPTSSYRKEDVQPSFAPSSKEEAPSSFTPSPSEKAPVTTLPPREITSKEEKKELSSLLPTTEKALEKQDENNKEELMSSAAISQVNEALHQLTNLSKRPAVASSKNMASPSTKTLEDITQEILKPYLQDWVQENVEPLTRKLLKHWLEQHLPPLVERMVAEQIRKITNEEEEV